jgi:hypothetical protein
VAGSIDVDVDVAVLTLVEILPALDKDRGTAEAVRTSSLAP